MLLAVVRVRSAHTLAALPTQMHGCRAIHCARVDKVHVRSGLHAKARVTAGPSRSGRSSPSRQSVTQPKARGEQQGQLLVVTCVQHTECPAACARCSFTTSGVRRQHVYLRAPSTGERTVRKGHRQRMMRALPVARRTHHESRHCTASSKRGSSKMTAGAAAHHQALVQYLFTLRCQNFGGRCHGRLCQLAYECSWPSICRSAQSPSLQHLWICAAST